MSLFLDNCQFLTGYLPYGGDLVRDLKSVPDQAWKIDNLNDPDYINLCRDGKLVYQNGAMDFAKQEVTAYLNDPARYYIMRPIVEIEEGKTASRFRKKLYEKVGDWEYFPEPTSDAGYAVIFGLGLGLHLSFLVQYLPVDHFIFCESDLVQFRACCEVYSFRELITMLEGAGKKVSLLVTDMVSHLGNAAMNEMRNEFHVSLDGSYVYQHSIDLDGSLEKARNYFNESLSTLEYSTGFFEDECLMFKNTLENLSKHDFHLMPKTPVKQLGLPALVVGSGPSVDDAIDILKKNENNAILFSGGTSYTILKRNGMTPDFHTLYENDALNYDVMKDFSEKFPFEDTCLIAPMTIDPRTASFFKSVIFYFRDSLSPTLLLSESDQVVTSTGPTVSNVACRASISMGVDSISMFGIDLGGPSEEEHHSKDTIYHFDKGRIGEDSGRQFDELDRQLIPIQGTYHDVIYTNRLLMQARMYFESMFLEFSQMPVNNCSDGAKIAGVHDVRPTDLTLSLPKVKKVKAREEMINSWDFYKAGSYVKKHHLDDFEEAVVKIFDGIEAICKEPEKLMSFQDLLSKIGPLVFIGQDEVVSSTPANAAKTLVLGTMQQLFQTGHYLYRRAQETQATDFMKIFCQTILPFLVEMRECSRSIIKTARSH